jgi:non-ribosomal peptide synthetase component E (peptide arylation enzyme)
VSFLISYGFLAPPTIFIVLCLLGPLTALVWRRTGLAIALDGVADEEWGESVAAYVARQPGSAIGEAAILERCRRNLAGYKKPRHAILIDALPRTAVNEISKAALRDLFAATATGVRSGEGGNA